MACRREWLDTLARANGTWKRMKPLPYPQLLASWRPSERNGVRVFLAERTNQGDKFFRPCRIAFDVGLEVVKADRRLQDNTRREPYVAPAGFRFVGPLCHLDSQFSLFARIVPQ